MYFSDYFKIEKRKIEEYGAIDLNLICDIPLFIDPMLIFNSKKDEYIILHEGIIKYFHFLAIKSEQGFSEGDLTTYFDFSEIKNNWLGYSKSGNDGNGNGKDFSRFFAQNIKFALQTNGISKGKHFEKAILLFEGNGRDKISDLTTHLILDYLATYTQEFAIKNIDEKYLATFYLDARFNYETESFESVEYTLPFVYKKGKKEFILLTPIDILRKDEPTINRKDLILNYDRVRSIIDNKAIRSQLENYIFKAVSRYEKECKYKRKKPNERKITVIERKAFIEALSFLPEIYDYYVRLKENDKEAVIDLAISETCEQIEKFYIKSHELVELFNSGKFGQGTELSAKEEARQRLLWFKHIIEDCDGYKILYHKGAPIAKEDDLQRLFRFAWYGSKYDVNYETNNGRGESDVKVSLGSADKNIAEFKLASNPRLSHLFDQVAIYEKANQCNDSLYAIFYFSATELLKINTFISNTKTEQFINENIILIDCRNDNKASASTI